jgi:hypothetical protein
MSDKIKSSDKTKSDTNTLIVDTYFQKMARRAGGVPRAQALESAQTAIDNIKLSFSDWLDRELAGLTAEIRKGKLEKSDDLGWAAAAGMHSRRMRDVGTTMGFALVTFIANNLSRIFEAIVAGEKPQHDVIDCHIDALQLAKQEQYRHLRPEQLPELSTGLQRVLEFANEPSHGGFK